MTIAAKRQYRSELRAAQARQTRQTIVSAAGRLFARDGFGATTIDAIAADAGVSRKTVFTAVGGKIELLKLALDWAIAGDDEPVSVADRSPMSELMQQKDPAALLGGWARMLAEIDDRVAPLVRAMEIAADLDSGARSVYETALSQRLQGARDVVARLRQLEALNDDLTAEEATDIVWPYGDPALYERLVRQRRWRLDRFAEWLGDSLCRELLA
jgi:AcrR family transcriptional regulator